jgi:hypothetical protein
VVSECVPIRVCPYAAQLMQRSAAELTIPAVPNVEANRSTGDRRASSENSGSDFDQA